MALRIEDIVDRAIEHTLTIVASSHVEWSVARKGLERIRDDLAVGAPGHAAVQRLNAFIADQDGARAER